MMAIEHEPKSRAADAFESARLSDLRSAIGFIRLGGGFERDVSLGVGVEAAWWLATGHISPRANGVAP